MALFREQTGKSLPKEGGVEAWHYLNAGLTRETAEKIVSIMPVSGTLAAGRKSAGDQFRYRFNTDGKTIVAALASFHNNLHIAFLASSTPEVYKMPCRFPHATYTQPGQMLAMMPKIERSRRIILPGLGGGSHFIRVSAQPKSE